MNYTGPKIEYTLNGGYLKVAKTTEGIFDGPKDHNGVGISRRGLIIGMSVASRRRLIRKLSTLDRGVMPIFVTLTYPDYFPIASKVKEHIDKFGKRLVRRGWSAVWKLEYKARKSGDNIGQVAPHFHLLVYNAGYSELLLFVGRAWFEVVASGDDRHLAAGTRVEECLTWAGVMAYVSKYIAKADLDVVPANCGRFWGILGHSRMPFCPIAELRVDRDVAVRMMRLMRRYLKNGKNRKRWIRSNQDSMTIIVQNPERWLCAMVDQ